MNYEEEFGLEDEDVVEIRDLLDALADAEATREATIAPYVEQITALQAQLDEATADLDAQIAALHKAIKQAVIAHGNSVQTERFHAIYVKPRVSWDTQRLEGYAEAHPEILTFRREGSPSVRFRAID